jgi:hypothetical protein
MRIFLTFRSHIPPSHVLLRPQDAEKQEKEEKEETIRKLLSIG